MITIHPEFAPDFYQRFYHVTMTDGQMKQVLEGPA